MEKFLLLAFVVILFSASAAFAVDTAIVATDKTSIDGLVAAVAGDNVGAPVFIAENGEVSQETIDAITDSGAMTVVVVGGPSVVSEDAFAALESAFDTVRLWGIERTGTAIEVAKYFFADSDCAVLVDDTMDSEADSRRQVLAANLASHRNCALIPVPRGDIPASVLETLDELGFDDVHYVGASLNSELRARLRFVNLNETTGDDDEIEDEIEDEIGDESNKLILIAAPNWPHVLAFGSHPNSGTLVKVLSDANQTDRAIAFIQEHNITEVKVVGKPDLASEIADNLRDAGIEPTVVSGERAAEVSRRVWTEEKERFEQIERDRGSRIGLIKTKIKAKFRAVLNNTEIEFESEQIELGASDVDVTALMDRLHMAQQLIENAKGRLEAGDTDGARLLWAEARGFFEAKWNDRTRIKWEYREKLMEEESDIDDILGDVREEMADLQNALQSIRDRCANSNAIENLVNRARSLREEISAEVQAENYGRAAQLVKEVKILVGEAKHLREICERRGDLPEFAISISERHRERTEDLFEKIDEERRMEIEGKDSEVPKEVAPREVQVVKTSDGFEPREIQVSRGGTVTWTNQADDPTWPASAVHPTHTAYPGSDIQKCGTSEEDKIFDACSGLAKGESYTFKFDEAGTWFYHDHLTPSFTGKITVVE